MLTAIDEGEAGSGDEVADRARDQDLGASGDRRDARVGTSKRLGL
jgi:hypothetical protein